MAQMQKTERAPKTKKERYTPKITKWAKNAARSLKDIGLNSLSQVDSSGGINDFISQNGDFFKDVAKSTVHLRQTFKKTSAALKKTEIYSGYTTLIKNAWTELKTGNLYSSSIDYDNNQELNDYMSDSTRDNADGEAIYDPQLETKLTQKTILDVGKATTTMIGKSAEYMVASNQASDIININNHKESMKLTGAGFASVSSQLDAMLRYTDSIAGNLNRITDFYSSTANTLNGIKDSLSAITQKMAKEEEQSRVKQNASSADSSSGSQFSKIFGAYGNQVNLKALLKQFGSNFASGNGFIQNAMEIIGTEGVKENPIGTLLSIGLSSYMPTIIEKSVSAIGETFKTFFQNFSLSLNDLGSQLGDTRADGKPRNPLVANILNSLGIKMAKVREITPGGYEKGPVPFDGITRQAIIKVIPEYLSSIESLLYKKFDNDSSGKRYFDTDTGTFKFMAELRNERLKKQEDEISGTVNGATQYLTKVFNTAANKSGKYTREQVEQMDKDIDLALKAEYEQIAQTNRTFNPNDKNSAFYKYLTLTGRFSDSDIKGLAKALTSTINGRSIVKNFTIGVGASLERRSTEADRIQKSGNTTAFLDVDGSQRRGNIASSIISPQINTNNTETPNNSANATPSNIITPAGEEIRKIIEKATGRKIGAQEGEIDLYGTNLLKTIVSNEDIAAIDLLREMAARKLAGGNVSLSDEELAKINAYMEKTKNKSSIDENIWDEAILIEAAQELTTKSADDKRAGGIFTSFFKDNAENLGFKKEPTTLVGRLLLSADKKFFDFIFGNEDDKDNQEGFAIKMANKLDDLFDKIREKIEDKFGGNIKERLKEYASELFRPYWQDIKERFTGAGSAIKDTFKGTKSSIRRTIRNDNIGKLRTIIGRLSPEGDLEFNEDGDIVYKTSGKKYRGSDRIAKEEYDIISKSNLMNADFSDEESENMATSRSGLIDALKQTEVPTMYNGGVVPGKGPRLAILSGGEQVINPNSPKEIGLMKKKEIEFANKLGLGRLPKYAEGTVETDSIEEYEDSEEYSFIRPLMEESRLGGFILDMVPEDSRDNIKDVLDSITNNAPKFIGSGVFGGALGFVAGVPLLGAALGASASLIKNSKKLNSFFFGVKDEEGNVIEDSGIISAETQDFINNALPDIKKDSILGAAIGMIPGGFGVVPAAALGAGIGLIKNSQRAQEFLFGVKDEEGNIIEDNGLISEAMQKYMKKAAPNALKGLGIGGVAGLLNIGPFGILGNAVIGAGVGLLSSSDEFKDAILGKRGEDGTREGGLVGSIKDNVLTPAKDVLIETIKDAAKGTKEFIRKNIVNNIVDAARGVTQMIGNLAIDARTAIQNMVFENFTPDEDIKRGTRRIVSAGFNVLRAPVKLAANVAALPFKAIGAAGRNLTARQIREGRASSMSAEERMRYRGNNKEKFRNRSKDKFATIDEKLVSMNDTEIAALRASADVLNGSLRSKKDAVRYSKQVLSEFSRTIEKNNFIDLIGERKYKRIQNAILDGDVETFRSELVDSKLSKENVSGLIDLFEAKINNIAYSKMDASDQRRKEDEFAREFQQKLLPPGSKFGKKEQAHLTRMLDKEFATRGGFINKDLKQDENTFRNTIIDKFDIVIRLLGTNSADERSRIIGSMYADQASKEERKDLDKTLANKLKHATTNEERLQIIEEWEEARGSDRLSYTETNDQLANEALEQAKRELAALQKHRAEAINAREGEVNEETGERDEETKGYNKRQAQKLERKNSRREKFNGSKLSGAYNKFMESKYTVKTRKFLREKIGIRSGLAKDNGFNKDIDRMYRDNEQLEIFDTIMNNKKLLKQYADVYEYAMNGFLYFNHDEDPIDEKGNHQLFWVNDENDPSKDTMCNDYQMVTEDLFNIYTKFISMSDNELDTFRLKVANKTRDDQDFKTDRALADIAQADKRFKGKLLSGKGIHNLINKHILRKGFGRGVSRRINTDLSNVPIAVARRLKRVNSILNSDPMIITTILNSQNRDEIIECLASLKGHIKEVDLDTIKALDNKITEIGTNNGGLLSAIFAELKGNFKFDYKDNSLIRFLKEAPIDGESYANLIKVMNKSKLTNKTTITELISILKGDIGEEDISNDNNSLKKTGLAKRLLRSFTNGQARGGIKAGVRAILFGPKNKDAEEKNLADVIGNHGIIGGLSKLLLFGNKKYDNGKDTFWGKQGNAIMQKGLLGTILSIPKEVGKLLFGIDKDSTKMFKRYGLIGTIIRGPAALLVGDDNLNGFWKDGLFGKTMTGKIVKVAKNLIGGLLKGALITMVGGSLMGYAWDFIKVRWNRWVKPWWANTMKPKIITFWEEHIKPLFGDLWNKIKTVLIGTKNDEDNSYEGGLFGGLATKISQFLFGNNDENATEFKSKGIIGWIKDWWYGKGTEGMENGEQRGFLGTIKYALVGDKNVEGSFDNSIIGSAWKFIKDGWDKNPIYVFLTETAFPWLSGAFQTLVHNLNPFTTDTWSFKKDRLIALGNTDGDIKADRLENNQLGPAEEGEYYVRYEEDVRHSLTLGFGGDTSGEAASYQRVLKYVDGNGYPLYRGVNKKGEIITERYYRKNTKSGKFETAKTLHSQNRKELSSYYKEYGIYVNPEDGIQYQAYFNAKVAQYYYKKKEGDKLIEIPISDDYNTVSYDTVNQDIIEKGSNSAYYKTATQDIIEKGSNSAYYTKEYQARLDSQEADAYSNGSSRNNTGLARHIYQKDPTIANKKYGNSTIGDAGCGPVAAANLMGGNLDLATTLAKKGNFIDSNGGTYINYFSSIFNGTNTNDKTVIKNRLKQGLPVVLLGRDNTNGVYGTNNHFVTAKGYDKNGNIIVEDPDLPQPEMRYKESKVFSGLKEASILGKSRRSGKANDRDRMLNMLGFTVEDIEKHNAANPTNAVSSSILNTATNNIGPKITLQNDLPSVPVEETEQKDLLTIFGGIASSIIANRFGLNADQASSLGIGLNISSNSQLLDSSSSNKYSEYTNTVNNIDAATLAAAFKDKSNIKFEDGKIYITGNDRERMVRVIESQYGYAEPANVDNDTKYGIWYNMNMQPWCAMFVSWCAEKAGIPTSIISKTASTTAHYKFFAKNGSVFSRAELPGSSNVKYKPKPGDIVIYQGYNEKTKQWEIQHTGTVFRVYDNGTYDGLDGNWGSAQGMVRLRSGKTFQDQDIYAIAVPKYTNNVKTIVLDSSDITQDGANLIKNTGYSRNKNKNQYSGYNRKKTKSPMQAAKARSPISSTAQFKNIESKVYQNYGSIPIIKRNDISLASSNIGNNINNSYQQQILYDEFLNNIITILINISSNTEPVAKILEVLSKEGNNISAKAREEITNIAKNSNNTQDILRAILASRQQSQPSDLLVPNKKSDMVIQMMTNIAKQ